MNNKEYVELVHQKQFPTAIKVPLDKPYQDERGLIQNLWLGLSGSITLITSKKGSIRASHYHTDGDWHAIYVLSGSIEYIESTDHLQENNKPSVIFKAGEMVFSRPEVYHKVIALEDTIFLTINNILKNHENYEENVKRVK